MQVYEEPFNLQDLLLLWDVKVEISLLILPNINYYYLNFCMTKLQRLFPFFILISVFLILLKQLNNHKMYIFIDNKQS